MGISVFNSAFANNRTSAAFTSQTQIIAEKVFNEAKDNNLAAVKEITDRTEGKAAQQVQFSGDINTTVYVMERLKELKNAEERVEHDGR